VQNGHDVVGAWEKTPDPGDQALLEWATAENRILVTLDTDFGDLVFSRGLQHSGLVRLPDVPVNNRIELIRQLLARHSQEIADGAIVTVKGGRIRISHIP
jgi:predicted nuclease of predicted toxin-antitoxin system